MDCNRRAILAGLAIGLMLPGIQVASAEEKFIDKAVHLIVAFPAGGGIDLVARVLAPKLRDSIGQNVVVENNSGGAGFIGVLDVTNSRADGSSLLLHTMGMGINAAAYKKVPYDSIKDVAPVALIGTTPYFIGLSPTLPFKTLPEFLVAAKAEPGKYRAASFATAPGMLTIGLLKQRAGIDLEIIPYRGVAPSAQAVTIGEVDFLMVDGASLLPFIDSGRIRGVAVASRERSPDRPDLPTVIESGVPDFVIESWFGIFARGGTPTSILDRWNSEINKALAMPDVQERLRSVGMQPAPRTREAFVKIYHDEIARWKDVVAKGNIPLLD